MQGFGQHNINYQQQQQQQQQTPIQNGPLCLEWNRVETSSVYADDRIRCVVDILKGMRMPVSELLCRVLSKHTQFKASRTKFMKDPIQIGNLLNLIAQDDDGRKTLEGWLRSSGLAADVVCAGIDREMGDAIPHMRMKVKDITYESVSDFSFEDHVTGVLKTCVPTLSRVLYTAAQGSLAAKKNPSNAPDFVSVV